MTEGNIKSTYNNSSLELQRTDYSGIIPYIGDINILMDTSGTILRASIPQGSPIKDLQNWSGKNINDFLTIESKEKLDIQITSLSDISQKVTKWFELNHNSPKTGEFPIRYKGFKVPKTNHILLVGNDLSPVAEIQKKLE